MAKFNSPFDFKQYKLKYPKAFEYFIAKNPTSISITDEGISFNFSKTGKQLIYDIEDVINIEKALTPIKIK